jgi:hypothetical protein
MACAETAITAIKPVVTMRNSHRRMRPSRVTVSFDTDDHTNTRTIIQKSGAFPSGAKDEKAIVVIAGIGPATSTQVKQD